jgi:chromosomal replication initiation ATPase DnaA
MITAEDWARCKTLIEEYEWHLGINPIMNSGHTYAERLQLLLSMISQEQTRLLKTDKDIQAEVTRRAELQYKVLTDYFNAVGYFSREQLQKMTIVELANTLSEEVKKKEYVTPKCILKISENEYGSQTNNIPF